MILLILSWIVSGCIGTMGYHILMNISFRRIWKETKLIELCFIIFVGVCFGPFVFAPFLIYFVVVLLYYLFNTIFSQVDWNKRIF